MDRDVEVSCRCGNVHGHVTGASPGAVNRVVCYCSDCQAFVHWLRRPDLLDAHAGSHIVQVAPAALSFDRGQEHIRCVKLSDKGMYRWYASCCNTPLGNSPRPAIPFIGLLTQGFVGGPAVVDQAFGVSRGSFFGEFGVGDVPQEARRLNVLLLLRSIWRILSFRFSGKAWPHPYFERETQAPRYPVAVLTTAERDALRPLCGPRPSASASAHA